MIVHHCRSRTVLSSSHRVLTSLVVADPIMIYLKLQDEAPRGALTSYLRYSWQL